MTMNKADIFVDFGSFSDTTMRVEPLSQKGREWFCKSFGDGAVSANVKKSDGANLDRQFAMLNLSVNVKA